MVVDSDGGGNDEFADLSGDAARLSDTEAQHEAFTLDEQRLVLQCADQIAREPEDTDRDYDERIFNSLDTNRQVSLDMTLRKVRAILDRMRVEKIS